MPKKNLGKHLMPQERIESKIYLLRNKRVMLDRDLAGLYEVSTKALNQAVKRNLERFPDDFMFRLTQSEKDELVTNCDRFKKLKHSTTQPYAFTEQGVAMLSSVLKSPVAILVNIQIIRTFMRLKEAVLSHKDIWLKIHEIEKKYDTQFQAVFKAIKMLLDDRPDEAPPRRFDPT